jgi:hypothetical protein
VTGVSKCMYSHFDGSVGKVSALIHLSIPVYRLSAARTEYSHGKKKSVAIDYHRPVIGLAHMNLTRVLPGSCMFFGHYAISLDMYVSLSELKLHRTDLREISFSGFSIKSDET